MWDIEFEIITRLRNVNVPSTFDFLRHMTHHFRSKIPDVVDLVFLRAEYILLNALSTTLINIHPRQAAVAAFYKALEYSGISSYNQVLVEISNEKQSDIDKAVKILVRAFNKGERSLTIKKRYYKTAMDVSL